MRIFAFDRSDKSLAFTIYCKPQRNKIEEPYLNKDLAYFFIPKMTKEFQNAYYSLSSPEFFNYLADRETMMLPYSYVLTNYYKPNELQKLIPKGKK